MSGATTELNLSTAVDSDDNADYLTINLANSLRTLDALFNNVTGHSHNGAHQGGPVAPAAGSITGGMIADGTIASTDIADGSITNADLGPDVARGGLLSNGGFEIWQRGTAFGASNSFTADRWMMQIGAGDAYSVSKDTTHQDVGSQACAYLSFTYGGGAGASNLFQQLKTSDLSGLGGRTVSFSVRVNAAVANAIRAIVGSDGTGGTSAYSAYHTGSGGYQTLTVTYSVPTNATYVTAGVQMTAGGPAATFYVDNACLVVGSQPANYVPLHPADDLARCLRYYETITGYNPMILGYGVAPGAVGYSLFWKAIKPVVPTVTKIGTWGITTNCSQPAIGTAGVEAAQLSTTLIATGNVQCQPTALTQGITVEANP